MIACQRWARCERVIDGDDDDDGTDGSVSMNSSSQRMQSQQRADDDGALTSEPNSSPPSSMAWRRSLPLTASIDIADSRLFHMRLRRLSQYYLYVFCCCCCHTDVWPCVYISFHCVSSLRRPHEQNTRQTRLFCLLLSKNRHQCIDLGVRRYGMCNYCRRRERSKWFFATALFRFPSLDIHYVRNYSNFDFENKKKQSAFTGCESWGIWRETFFLPSVRFIDKQRVILFALVCSGVQGNEPKCIRSHAPTRTNTYVDQAFRMRLCLCKGTDASNWRRFTERYTFSHAVCTYVEVLTMGSAQRAEHKSLRTQNRHEWRMDGWKREREREYKNISLPDTHGWLDYIDNEHYSCDAWAIGTRRNYGKKSLIFCCCWWMEWSERYGRNSATVMSSVLDSRLTAIYE